MLKIIYIANSTTIFGGGSKALYNLLYGLIEKGVVPLVVLPKNDGLCLELQEKGIRTRVLNYRASTYPPLRSFQDKCLFLFRLVGRICLNIKAQFEITKIIRDFRPNIIHTNVSIINIGYSAAQRMKIPHIWHIREYGTLDFHFRYCYTYKGFLKKLHAKNSYTICITRDIQRYDQLSNCSQSRVIYDGVLSKQQIVFCEKKESFFLFAGRLEPNKGIEELLSAYEVFVRRRPNCKMILKVAGDTAHKDYRNFLHMKVQREGIADRVFFLGMRSDVLNLMSKAYLMIVPSISEGFGFITAEAMFCGALVVGHNTAGTKEQFDNGVQLTGMEIALRYNTQDELVQRMCEVVDNGIENYFPMIHYSQQAVKELYSIEQHVEQVYNFYEEITKK